MIETTSLELSKRLADADAKQESFFCWCNGDIEESQSDVPEVCVLNGGEVLAAFTLAEMMEKLNFEYRLWKHPACDYLVYRTPEGEPEFGNKSATEAVGLLYEWALKEGLVKK